MSAPCVVLKAVRLESCLMPLFLSWLAVPGSDALLNFHSVLREQSAIYSG